MKKQLFFILCILALSGTACAQDETWQTVSIPDICTFQIPSTLELQKGMYKKIMDQFSATKPDSVVVQPKGINDLDPVALTKYCRIIVDTMRGDRGNYAKLDAPMALTAAELKELETLKDELQQAATLSSSMGMKMTILS